MVWPTKLRKHYQGVKPITPANMPKVEDQLRPHRHLIWDQLEAEIDSLRRLLQSMKAGESIDVTIVAPGEVMAESDPVPAAEALVAGDLVNIYTDAGAIKCRRADGSTIGKEANGFVLSDVNPGDTATVYHPSQSNTKKTGMTPGTMQYLSVTTPGGTQESIPTGSGQTLQKVGRAVGATNLAFAPQDPIVLA